MTQDSNKVLQQPFGKMMFRLTAIAAAILFITGCATMEPRSGKHSPVDGLIDDDVLTAIDQKQPHGKQWTQTDNLWHYIAAQMNLPPEQHPRITAERERYLKHPEYLEQISKRAEPYLYLIVQELEQRDLPIELVFVPFVESAFLPNALSSSSAAGIWQFIPSTGNYFGLENSHWYDARRDIVQSTQAAANYFQILHGIFGDDWPIVIGAYNSGEGTMQRAIKYNESRGLDTDFWSLDQLPRETQYYSARVYALAEIFSQPEKYGINPHPIKMRPVVTQLVLDESVNLLQLAKLTGIDQNELYRLNPGFNRGISGPDARHLLIPKEMKARFDAATISAAREPAHEWKRYTIANGDSFHRIARRYGSSVTELLTINRRESAVARPGEVILVPAGRVDIAAISENARTHTVRSGESLWSIARQYNVTVTDLQNLNALTDNDIIRPGDELIIALGPEPAESDENFHYIIVQPGDTLWHLARRYSTSVDELLSINGLSADHILQPGQQLIIASR